MDMDDLQRRITECNIGLLRIELRRNIAPWKAGGNAPIETLTEHVREMGARLDQILKRRKDRPGGLQ